MDLNLTPEQQDLVAAVSTFMDRRLDGAVVTNLDDPSGHARELLREFADLGWANLLIPESCGGADGTTVDLAITLEQLGRAAVQTPLVASSAVAAHVLLAAGDRQQEVGKIAQGLSVVTYASAGPRSLGAWDRVHATGRQDGRGWVVDGVFSLVPFATIASGVMFEAELDGRGRTVILLDIDTDGVEVAPQRVIGGEPRAAVRLRGVRISEEQLLSLSGPAIDSAITSALNLATILYTAHMVGAAETSLELSVSWAKDRVQFGRPIGSFQTVSNRCAEMRTYLDAARLLMLEAAWSFDTRQEDMPERVAVMKNYANRTGDVVLLNAHQIHGAMGYSTEYPLHVLTLAIKAYQASLGTTHHHLEKVAAAVIGL